MSASLSVLSVQRSGSTTGCINDRPASRIPFEVLTLSSTNDGQGYAYAVVLLHLALPQLLPAERTLPHNT